MPVDLPHRKLQILNLEAQPFVGVPDRMHTPGKGVVGSIMHSHFCIHSPLAQGRKEP